MIPNRALSLALGCALPAAVIRLKRLMPRTANLRILFSDDLCVPTIPVDHPSALADVEDHHSLACH
jgi:hypothetical protein